VAAAAVHGRAAVDEAGVSATGMAATKVIATKVAATASMFVVLGVGWRRHQRKQKDEENPARMGADAARERGHDWPPRKEETTKSSYAVSEKAQ
jgi:hypothetical protein